MMSTTLDATQGNMIAPEVTPPLGASPNDDATTGGGVQNLMIAFSEGGDDSRCRIDIDQAPSELAEQDITVQLVDPQSNLRIEIYSIPSTLCVTAQLPAVNRSSVSESDAGSDVSAPAPDAGSTISLPDAGSVAADASLPVAMDAAADAGLGQVFESDGWYLSEQSSRLWLELCPLTCRRWRDSAGSLLVSVDYGVLPGAAR